MIDIWITKWIIKMMVDFSLLAVIFATPIFTQGSFFWGTLYIYITYINVGCYYKYSLMLSHKALYNVTTNTKNIRTVVCANTKGHLLGTSPTRNLTIPNLILDPPLTKNLTIPCLFYVKNVFHRASSKVIIKNFSQQISRKCIIKLRARFTQHFRERGG